jgi:hypothetical protein
MIEFTFIPEELTNVLDTNPKTNVYPGLKCKTYYLTLKYNNEWYSNRLSKYDFTSLYVKIKSLPKILNNLEIARNIKTKYSIENGLSSDIIKLVFDLTITKSNKKVFETIEIPLYKCTNTIHIPDFEQMNENTCQVNENTYQVNENTYQVNENTYQVNENTYQVNENTYQVNQNTTENVQQVINNNISEPNDFILVTQELSKIREDNKKLISMNIEYNTRYCFEVGYQQGFLVSHDIATKSLIGEINDIKSSNVQMTMSNEFYQQHIPNLISWRESVEKYRNNLYTNENNIYLQ